MDGTIYEGLLVILIAAVVGYTHGHNVEPTIVTSASRTFRSGSVVQGNILSVVCDNVTQGLNGRKSERTIRMYGEKYNVVFSWSSDAERAASALLALAWRCAGYTDVTVRAHAEPHSLAKRHPPTSHQMIVGLSASYLLGDQWPLLFEMAGPGVASVIPRLHVRLGKQARDIPGCEQAIYNASFYLDTNKLQQCFLLTTRSKQPKLFIPLEWRRTFTELKSTMHQNTEPILKFVRKLFISDIIYVTRPELDKTIQDLQNNSFLFVDTELWENVKGVSVLTFIRPSSFSKQISIRFNDANLRRSAPSLYDAVLNFSPHLSDLREVLALESRGDDPLYAASNWTLQRSEHRDRLLGWLNNSVSPTAHYINIVYCNTFNDSYFDYLLKTIASKIKDITIENIIGITIHKNVVNCSSSPWGKAIQESFRARRFPRLIGMIMSGEGVYKVAEYAESIKLPLLAYSMTGSRKAILLGGTPELYVYALQQLFKYCALKRVAVISEKSAIALDVTAELQKIKVISYREVVLSEENEETIQKSLKSLLNDNARIFLVNGDSLFSKNIIRLARMMQLTPVHGYLWIVREWTGPGDEMVEPYEISFSYRGGENLTSNQSTELQQILEARWPNLTWPQYTTPLTNAILSLAYSFSKFTVTQPDAIDDVHSLDTYRGIMDNSISIDGLTGTFHLEKREVKKPYVYLYRWNGSRPDFITKWQVEKKLSTANGYCSLKFVPHDGSMTCHMSTGGEDFPPKCNDKLWMLSIFALSTIMFVFIILTIICRRTLRIREKRLTEEAEKMSRARLDAFISSIPPSFVDRTALKLRYQIGTGNFGCVWFGMLRETSGCTRAIAVKGLREGAVAEEQSEFFREVRNLALLQHDHVVQFVGVCVTDGPPLLLMEYAFFGDLLQYLRNRRHLIESTVDTDSMEATHVSAEALTRHAYEAAAALAFLASRGFVHRDVRAENCLIDEKRVLKLADFGMARKMSSAGNERDGEYWCRRRSLFPVLWMAPESLSRGVFSTASDVWALGVLALELITMGARPYGQRSPLSVVELVTAGGRPPLPPEVSQEAHELLLRCWQRTPSLRPTADRIISWLKERPQALRPALDSDASSSVDVEIEDVDSGISEPPGPSSPISLRSLSFEGNFLDDDNTK